MNTSFRISLRFTAALALSTLLSTPLALAASPIPTPNAAARLTAVQTKGDADINARLTSLNTLISKLGETKKLTTDQQTALTTEMQGEVTSLTALKTKLDADTDLATARADFATIFSAHYIYAFYLPRVERIVAADAELDSVTTLGTLATTLQSYIDQAQTAGNDVTALQAKLNEMKSKTTDAETLAQTALDSLRPLTASGYPANKTTIQTAGTTLKTGRIDLETARSDAKSLVASLKLLLKLQ